MHDPAYDELPLRRPNWTEGHWLALDAIGTWSIPIPVPVGDLIMTPVGSWMSPGWRINGERDGTLTERLGRLAQLHGEDLARYSVAYLAHLLSRNYVLTEVDCEALLLHGVRSTDSGEMAALVGEALRASFGEPLRAAVQRIKAFPPVIPGLNTLGSAN